MDYTTISEALQCEGEVLNTISGTVSRVFDRKVGKSRTGKPWSCQTIVASDPDTGEETRLTFWGQPPLALQQGQDVAVTGKIEVKIDEYLSNKNNERTLCLDIKQGAKILDGMGQDVDQSRPEPEMGQKSWASKPARQAPAQNAPQKASAAPSADPEQRLNQLEHLMLRCLQDAHTIAEALHTSRGLELGEESIRAMAISLWIETKGTGLVATMDKTPMAPYDTPGEGGDQ